MSEDGGLEEVEESLRAAASCACNWATVAWSWATVVLRASRRACWAASCACNRSQLAQGVVASVPMRAYSIAPRLGGTPPRAAAPPAAFRIVDSDSDPVNGYTLSNVKGRYGSFGDLEGNPGQTEISDVTLENIAVRLEKEKLNAA